VVYGVVDEDKNYLLAVYISIVAVLERIGAINNNILGIALTLMKYYLMKTILSLLLLCSLWSCRKRDDVLCRCQGGGNEKWYDFGIQTNPTIPPNAARCDTLGAHDGLDSCQLFMHGD